MEADSQEFGGMHDYLMLASTFCSYSCHVTSSTPTAAVFFRLKKAAFSLTQQDRHTKVVPCSCFWGGSSMAGLRYPSHGRSRQNGLPVRPSAEGRSSWLHFPRTILSFAIPNRFIPAHNVAFVSSSSNVYPTSNVVIAKIRSLSSLGTGPRYIRTHPKTSLIP